MICILFVVFGHSFHQYPTHSAGYGLLINRMMYSFRMPTFMFVSGFLMAHTTFLRHSSVTYTDYKRFVSQKVKRLLLPFLFLSVLTYIPRTLMNGISDDSLGLSLSDFLSSLFYSDCLVIPFFWFIQASFLLLLCSYTFIYVCEFFKLDKRVYLSLLVIIYIFLHFVYLTDLTFFAIGHSLFFGIFFVIGIVYAYYQTAIDRCVSWHSPILCLFITLCWIGLFFVTENTYGYLFCQICGILMITSFARFLDFYEIRLFGHLVGANYIIFLLSWYFNVLSQQVLSHYVTLPWYVYTLLSITTGVYIPLFIYRYLSKHQKTPFIKTVSVLLGQSFKTQKLN